MKKLLFLILALVSFAALAQTSPAPQEWKSATDMPLVLPIHSAAQAVAQALPAFEAYLGVGQVAVSQQGNAVAYTANFQTQLTAGFRWFPTERFAIEGQYFHDTVSIARYLAVHNYITPVPTEAYKYSAFAAQAEYWFLRDTHGGAYAFVAPQYFFSTQGVNGALGYAAGVGGQWCFWKGLFVESKAQFWHVQNYLVPVANTFQGSVSIGYRF